jgi:hypothetical protein
MMPGHIDPAAARPMLDRGSDAFARDEPTCRDHPVGKVDRQIGRDAAAHDAVSADGQNGPWTHSSGLLTTLTSRLAVSTKPPFRDISRGGRCDSPTVWAGHLLANRLCRH